MFKAIFIAAGFTLSRSYFGKALVIKALTALFPRRLQDCLHGLRCQYRNPQLEVADLSKLQAQDCLLGLDFVFEVTNAGESYVFGVDVTTNVDAIDKKLAEKQALTAVYKHLGIDRVCIVEVNVGDYGWLALEEEAQEQLIDRAYNLVEKFIESDKYVFSFKLT